MSTELTPKKSIYDGTGGFNALKFVLDNAIADVATAVPVKVVAVHTEDGSAGYVDVLPLVTFVAGDGNAVQPVTLYHLPYSRVQGGIAALIIDPVVGDIGLAVFAQSDTSNVAAGTAEPQQPGSHRHHSQSDGFYIGGFLNQHPSCYLELTQDNTATLTAIGGITINGNVTVSGTITASGDIKAGNISVQGHTHTGVHGETSPAN